MHNLLFTIRLIIIYTLVTGENKLCHDRGLNPGRARDRRTLYHVAIKVGLYRKLVQQYHIPIPGDTLMYKISWKKKMFMLCTLPRTYV